MKSLLEVAEAAARIGKARCTEPASQTFYFGILGGGFVGLAGLAMLTLVARLGSTPDSIGKLLAGIVFTAGLVMVVTAGGQLFTGNCMMPLGIFHADYDCTWGSTLRNWVVVYIGNFVGALIVILLFWASDLWAGDGALAKKAIAIAQAKVSLSFTAAFARGILCNWLVTLGVWIVISAESVSDKVLGVFFPIVIFVLSGYEHSVANMFFLPTGWLMTQIIPGSGTITMTSMIHSFIPVTLGNAVGGVFFIPLLYTLALGVGRKKG